MSIKIRKFSIALMLSGIVLVGQEATASVTLSNFGNNIQSFGSWTYNGTTSTLTGNDSPGNVIGNEFIIPLNITGLNQLQLIANVTTAPASGFTIVLEDDLGDTATAAFAGWSDFVGGPVARTATILMDGPTFQFSAISSWQILSGGADQPINAQFTSLIAIPEPSSAALLLFGSAAFLWLRKRRTA